ncbi:Dyp-type peroxidase [Pyxidicoccus xibeiensis]|uniref:Dyp-type peroxidase n=1 Tax=Pyxidicoccus xibeiensis TaxID=2906759 RepID=UPI0020A7127E|nr:peroxidase [Pyxidicoccus xibeiensis]MCP3142479.1 peroxidase [Pyxidicoccus xibeiensis]
MQSRFDFEDIQAILFTAHGGLRLARHVFLQFGDAERARHWLGRLANEVTTEAHVQQVQAGRGRAESALHVALTAEGLRALGLADDVLDTFPLEFLEGMAHENRSRVLGDTGRSAPGNWDYGGPGAPIHLVLMLYAAGSEGHRGVLEALHARQREHYTAHGLKELARQDTVQLARPGEKLKEPFGFSDGITQPGIEGYHKPSTQGLSVKPGEFILGYENAYGEQPLSPAVPAALDAGQHLPGVGAGAVLKDLGRNGTYLVLRKLRQDVEAFEAFLDAHSRDAREREWLAARLVGRWRSGAPTSLCPAQDDPGLGEDPSRNNCFSYAQDPQGLMCPLGAHIRRANPRDGLIPGNREASLKVVARHQLLRRGRPYHEPDGAQGGEARGLIFIALNANLRRQFELIQHSWLNSTKFNGHFDSKDPLLGDNPEAGPGEVRALHGEAAGTVTIPDFPIARRIEGLTRFVDVRGGGYFFLPGVNALRFLARLPSAARRLASAG